MSKWFIPWDISYSYVFFLICLAAFYIKSQESIKKSLPEIILFWSGLFIFYMAWPTRLNYYAEHQFFMGRVQQAALQHTAPFLVALGMPRVLSRYFLSRHHRWVKWLIHPFMLIVLFDAIFLVWLVPDVHFIAMLDWRLYDLMNWSMVVSGLLFWICVFDKNSSYSALIRISTILAVVPVQIVAGLLLVFSRQDIYSIYSICGRAWENIGPLEDQQVGGAILWIHGTMMSVIGAIVIATREFKQKN